MTLDTRTYSAKIQDAPQTTIEHPATPTVVPIDAKPSTIEYGAPMTYEVILNNHLVHIGTDKDKAEIAFNAALYNSIELHANAYLIADGDIVRSIAPEMLRFVNLSLNDF